MTYNSVVSQVFAEFEREGFEYKYKYYPDLTIHQIFKNSIELIRVEVKEKSHTIVTEYRKLSPELCQQGNIIFKRLIREKNSYEWAIAEIKKLQTPAAIDKEGGFVISQCEYILPITSKSFRSWLAHWIKTQELPAWDTPTGFIKLVQEYYEPFEGALVAEIWAETWAFRPLSQKNSGVRSAIRPVKVEQCLAIRFEADVLPEDERKIRFETVCIYELALAYFEAISEAIEQKWLGMDTENNVPEQIGHGKQRKRGPSTETLARCNEAMKYWLDEDKALTKASDLAHIDKKTVERWILNVLEIVDIPTKDRWMQKLKALKKLP